MWFRVLMQLFFVDFIPPLDQNDFKIDLVFFTMFLLLLLLSLMFFPLKERKTKKDYFFCVVFRKTFDTQI